MEVAKDLPRNGPRGTYSHAWMSRADQSLSPTTPKVCWAKAPVLTREGYELVGGRLLPGDTGAVAQFMYQDGQGRRLTLYVSRVAKDGGDTAFRYSRENEVSVFYWIDGTVAYALSGAMSRENLLAVATSVYKQLNP